MYASTLVNKLQLNSKNYGNLEDLRQGWTNFPQTKRLLQNQRRQKGDMQQVPYNSFAKEIWRPGFGHSLFKMKTMIKTQYN